MDRHGAQSGTLTGINPGTPAALQSLCAEGIHIVMLTSENWTTAAEVVHQLGVDDVHTQDSALFRRMGLS